MRTGDSQGKLVSWVSHAGDSGSIKRPGCFSQNKVGNVCEEDSLLQPQASICIHMHLNKYVCSHIGKDTCVCMCVHVYTYIRMLKEIN